MAEVAEIFGMSPINPETTISHSRTEVARAITRLMPFEESGSEIEDIVFDYLPDRDITLRAANQAANDTYALLNEDHLRS